MKTKLCLLFLALAVTLTRAQTNDLTSLLQQGLMEEQANRNLDAAITDYQALATQFDKNRQIAATAIFRLGECYRMQGRTNEAGAQYQRILDDFSDQQTLATMSRQDLAGMNMAPVNKAVTADSATLTTENDDLALWNRLKDLPKPELEKVLPTLIPDDQLESLLPKRNQEEETLAELQVDYSPTNIVVLRVRAALDVLNQQISDRLNGLMNALKMRAEISKSGGATGLLVSNNTYDEEDQVIQRIQQMIQNSPDLINVAPWGGDATPLANAATQGWLKVAAYLLAHGADVNAANSRALFAATRAGNRAMVELLLSHGAQVDAHGFNNEAETPLDMAVADGFQAVVEVLLANKADVNAQERSGKTPLYLAAQRGDPEIVSLLLDQKSDVNLADGAGATPLFAAVIGKHPEIVKLLLTAGAQINVQDDTGRTPLSYAAENDSPEILKMLLAAKADPNGGTFEPPLLAAILKQNTAAAESLLEAGADPNVATKIDFIGNYDVVYNHRDHLTPLWLAVSQDQFPMVQLLLKFKADPSDWQTDKNPLIFSAFTYTNILQALLDAGAKVDGKKDPIHWTPLFGAIDRNYVDAVKILLKYGANPHVQYLYTGDTPLHLAARKLADTNIFLALLDYQADPNVRNLNGATPLDMLKTSTNRTLADQLADLLRQHGALDKLPDWNHIIVSRPAAGFSANVFEKDTNNWNQFTLLEALVEFYKPPQLSPEAQVIQMESGAAAPQDALSFPDLAHVTIVRPQSDSTNYARLQVNLLNSTNGIDSSRDVPLEFGDVVEIPEYDHPLDSHHIGLTDAQYATMKNNLIGQAELLTQGQKVELPFHFYEDGSLIGQVLGQTEAQRILESSSDLSRVKVTRHDPKTGLAQSWILDCSNLGATSDLRARFGRPARMPGNQAPSATPDFRVRDGDVIEVPQKSE